MVLLAVNFFQSMSAQIANTVIPLYARDLGANAAMLGTIVSTFAITALAVRPFSGPAFDSFRKKPFMFAAYLVNMTAMFLYGVADTPGSLMAVRLLHGVGIGCAGPLGMAICNQILPHERLSSGISIYMLAFTVAQSVGPAFAVWFAGIVGYQVTFFTSGTLLAVSCALILFLKVPEIPNRPAYKIRPERIFAKPALIPAIMLCLLCMAFSAIGSFLVIYGMLRGVSDIALFFTVYAICLLITRPVFGKISDTRGTTVVLVPAIICFAVSYVLISQAASLPAFLIAAVVSALGFGICTPLMQALTFKIVPTKRSGAGSNTTYTGMDVGSLLGPVLAGTLVDVFTPVWGSEVAGYSTMWLLLIVPILASLAFYLASRKRIRRYAHAAAKEDMGL